MGNRLAQRIGSWGETIDSRAARRRVALACILSYVLALGVRLGIAELHGLNSPFPPPSDEQTYYLRAQNLAQGKGYVQPGHDGVLRPTAYQVPGAPLIMAASIRAFGNEPRSIRLAAVLISSLSAALMILFALEMSSFAVATAAGVVCAVYPSWVFFSASGFTEPYFVPFLIAALWLSTLAMRRHSSWLALAVGAMWGATGLIRPVAVPMAGLVVGYFLCRKKSLRPAALIALGCAIVLSPWLIRNEALFGHPILANEGGETFLGSNNPYALADPADHGLWVAPWLIPEYHAQMAPMRDELKENQLEYRIAIEFLKSHPGAIPKLVVHKLARALTPVTHTPGSVRYMVLASYGTLLLLLFVGITRRDLCSCPALHLVLLWSFVLCAITAVYWGNLLRGRLPLEIPWIPWASAVAVELAFSVRSRVTASVESPRGIAVGVNQTARDRVRTYAIQGGNNKRES
jgi:4-amino-4-deoxy-L-arabinose transferase-like glycosyltransferase